MTPADRHYQNLIREIIERGDPLETRNHAALSLIDSPTITFTETPLVTLRKTAWRKALREMEWFLSGDSKCPDELLDWWNGQLNADGYYLDGYGTQLRRFNGGFDQIEMLIDGLIQHPHSRRHVITTWNPVDMFYITENNGNPKTPSCCHMTVNQYFVRGRKLHARTYQRSADILLGVPHNWIQHWGLLLWLARRAKLDAGSLIWNFGDLHLYDEPSHREVASLLMETQEKSEPTVDPTLVYVGSGYEFKASDFAMNGKIPEPVTTIRPRLL